jgi:hypothetical protein
LFLCFGGDHGSRGGYLLPRTCMHVESSWYQLHLGRGRRLYALSPLGSFPAKLSFWIIWVERLGHLVIGPIPLIFGP